jgi:hypothetical protein
VEEPSRDHAWPLPARPEQRQPTRRGPARSTRCYPRFEAWSRRAYRIPQDSEPRSRVPASREMDFERLCPGLSGGLIRIQNRG